MTRTQSIAAAVTMLSETFRQPLSDAAAQGYLLALEDLSVEEVGMVCKRALRESKFMPSPSELLAYAGKAGAKAMTVRIGEAWEAVRGAMDKHDYTTSVDFGPLVNTVVRNMGSWPDLCSKSIPDLVWVRKDFERLYEAFADKDPATLRGEPLRGAFGGVPVRIAIGGVTPPLELPGAPSGVSAHVRALADKLSQP